MTSRIYTAMDRMQPPRRNARVDRSPLHAPLQKLAPRDDSVLSLRYLSDESVRRLTRKLFIYFMNNFGLTAHGGSVALRV